MRCSLSFRFTLAAALVIAALFATAPARAHCDTMDGPVVADARRALDSGDVAPTLKWIRPDDEAEIRAAFELALHVRQLGREAKDLADRSFFETLVRLHRAGEGASFTGLKPAGTAIEPIVLAADRALALGTEAELAAHLTAAVNDGLHRRFDAAASARTHAEHNPDMGRRFVAAYVELTHWLERLERDATSDAALGDVGGAHDEHAH